MVPEFRNEPLTDFSREENRRAMEAALASVESQLGREYPLIVGGERILTRGKIRSIDPAQPSRVVGLVSRADRELAERAIQVAAKAFEDWRRFPAEARARVLFKAAAIARRRKLELAAWMVFEVGKTWPEADADIAEAIDFLEFYGREMVRLGGEQPVNPVPGEENALYYIPLGVGVIIPPWNFPAAILTGMTSAAIVAGNAVVLKPASASPVIGYQVTQILLEAGVPEGVLNFLPGSGSEVGDYLVDHPLTRFVSFTGSKEVGLRIYERAARMAPGQRWLKRVVAEMGGKDAIIVDGTADLEAAAEGIVTSAFGYQGQKCSACSRAIVTEDVYDEVLRRVVERAERLVTGPPRLGSVNHGPVVDRGAYEKILAYIEIARQEGRLVLGGKPATQVEGAPAAPGAEGGYFIEPTIVADVDPKARIAQEEIFGPVLAFIKARDFEHALQIANDTEYGLTGSVYSRDRRHLELARAEFHVGNLYFNRKCTGALVGGHPFGGFNMSGTDSKAGGRDYLLLFTQAKAVAEKL